LVISTFFWDEIYGLYVYFNEKYGLSDFDCNDIGDFVSFGNKDDTDSDNERNERDHPYGYIGEFCACKAIKDWLVYEINKNKETVDKILREDIQHVGEILLCMIWA
jgi:hypothetical protein